MKKKIFICPFCGKDLSEKKWGKRYHCLECKEVFSEEDLFEEDPFLYLLENEDPE